MRQTSFRDFHCSLSRALEAAGDWWSPLILRDVFAGLRRFDELVEDLGISRNLLTLRLAALVEDGLLEKRTYGPHPNRFEYGLTEAGSEFVVVLMAMTAWGDRWQTPEGGPPITFSHHDHACTPTIVCDQCGEAIDVADVKGHVGPGGRVAPGTSLIGFKLHRPQRRSSV
jgi:DNA-binding HxlR family transcriptional regulator